MAYLYADPLVRKDRNLEKIVPVDVPLDLDSEYLHLVDILRHTGKQFKIQREAINVETLNQIIRKNPKIIHISCHGG